nr:sodium-dependent bicarbonate transport family permease [Leptolyngbya sp. Prado105]
LAAAIAMSILVPIYTFFILRTRLDPYNAAAIAATYGSISAVTFITAGSFLDQLQIPYNGYMVAALALMESPAIIIGLILVNVFTDRSGESESIQWSEVLQEAFFNGSVFLLIGSVLIGFITGEQGWQTLKPFTQDMFYGVLTFFLLDMGLVAAKRIQELQKSGLFLVSFGILIPLLNATIGIFLAKAIALSSGDALLFTVLCASASYIAVPAAMRLTVPEANPSFYISAALAITFPFNILLGIPLYEYGITLLW